MSLPEQEARALDEAWQFLLDICSRVEKGIPIEARKRAFRIARHYPAAAGELWLERTKDD